MGEMNRPVKDSDQDTGREIMEQKLDRKDARSSSAAFMTGLCAGATIGAGLALLFAPGAGSDLRDQISDAAASARNSISRSIVDMSERGRHVYERARDAVSPVGDEIDRDTTRRQTA